MNEKFKVIIDADPGVDDTMALVFALVNDRIDIQLITTVAGNKSLSICTRNTLHILDKFGYNLPVAKGAKRALCRKSVDASHIHGASGMGDYVPSKPKQKPVKENAVEAMFNVLKNADEPIYILAFGPHTNTAQLILKHPEIKSKIKGIIAEGCCPYGLDGRTHISFNVSTDPEAFKIILESGIPLTMIPSHMGRELAHLTEEECLQIKNMNDTGAFFYEMMTGYWERGWPDKRIAINDSCICIYLVHPEFFSVVSTNITVDTDDTPGKTIMDFNLNGKHNYLSGCDREKVHEVFIKSLEKLNAKRISK